jgi:hypothetical protein
VNQESPFAHLRPTTTPEMLDRAYTVATRLWPLLWGAGFIAGADHLLAAAMLQWGTPNTGDPLRVTTMLLIALAGDFAAAVALLAVFQGLIFPRRPVSPRAIFRTALRKFPGYFLTHLAWVILVAFCGIFAGRLLLTSVRAGIYNVNMVLAIVVALAALVFAVRLCLAPIACLIENGSPVGSFKRSWHLTAAWPAGLRFRKDRPAARLVASMAVPAIAVMVVAGAGLSFGIFGLGIPLPYAAPTRATSTMMELTGFFATGIAMPLIWAGLMALYVEYRMRREALDFYLRLRELSKDTDGSYPL